MNISKQALDLRTKDTVNDGLVYFNFGPINTVMFVDYQPGNGTRYWLYISDTFSLPDEVKIKLGFPKGQGSGYIVTDLNHGTTMLLAREGFISADYIQRHFSCGISDAYVLAELLGHLLDREYEKAGP